MDKDSKKDIGHALAKAGISTIPLVGAVASELLQLIVTPPNNNSSINHSKPSFSHFTQK